MGEPVDLIKKIKGGEPLDYFEQDLRKAHEFHGHICQGIVLGSRLARGGLTYLGIEDPAKNKDFIVYVEVDRCLSDAVQAITGCSLGKRRLKFVDYGKMAATFIDINTNKGIRIVVDAKKKAPNEGDIVSFWRAVSDEEMFKFEPVIVDLRPEDLPGKPTRRVTCELCQESIMDGRDLLVNGKTLCSACAKDKYYRKL